MGNEITKFSTGTLVSIIQEEGITTLIEPLVKEIFLFDTYLAGTSHIENQAIFNTIKINDKLILRRETDNKYDPKAILVLTQQNEKLGYIPRTDNEIFSRLLDAGKLLTASIKEIEHDEPYHHVRININLVDF